MKLSNKKLAMLLGILALLFGITQYNKKNTTKHKLKANVIALDTTAISKFEAVTIQNEMAPLLFEKRAEIWEVAQGELRSPVEQSVLTNLLTQFQNMKANRLVAKSKDAWKTYQLTDSLATKVQIIQNEDSIILYLGKTKFNPPTGQNGYSMNNISGATYFRVAPDPEIYLTEGMLTPLFYQPFNSWRKTEFAKLNKEEVTRIAFDYKNEKGFVLQKKDTVWHIENQVLDTKSVDQYLNLLVNKRIDAFNDSFKPTPFADYQMTVFNKNKEILEIISFKDSVSGQFYLRSSQNPDALLESTADGVQKELFVEASHFK